MFVGGYVLGSGPTWSRLPGPYQVAADSRSMDSETLAAVKWARDNIQPGSRIGADRVSATLFASEARLWPVMKRYDFDVPSLYFANDWGKPQTDAVRALQLSHEGGRQHEPCPAGCVGAKHLRQGDEARG